MAMSIVAQKLSKLATDTRDAALSCAWLYPLQGIGYFATHPVLYRTVAPTVIKSLVTSVAITGGLFFFTYLPQVAFCTLFSGPFAPIAAAVMVLGEAYVLVWIVGKPLMMAKVQDRLFDEVLLQKGHSNLVERRKEIRSQGKSVKVLGSEVMLPKPGMVTDGLSREGIVRYLVSLPLNSIPGIGTALFLVYNGEKQGPGYHHRYFALKGWDKRQRDAHVEKHKAEYTAFGAVALVLNMIPVVGMVFGMTTSIGAALWASEMEIK